MAERRRHFRPDPLLPPSSLGAVLSTAAAGSGPLVRDAACAQCIRSRRAHADADQCCSDAVSASSSFCFVCRGSAVLSVCDKVASHPSVDRFVKGPERPFGSRTLTAGRFLRRCDPMIEGELAGPVRTLSLSVHIIRHSFMRHSSRLSSEEYRTVEFRHDQKAWKRVI